MNDQHVLFVCTSCARDKQSNESKGEKLFEQFQLHQSESSNLSIQPVKCMGVCDRSCAIALVAPHKFTYLFGNLPSDDVQIDGIVSTVLDCAKQYCIAAEGVLPYRERPQLLRDTIIAKIPPLPFNA